MWDKAYRAVGVAAVAGSSFLLGTRFSSDNVSSLQQLHAATSQMPAPLPLPSEMIPVGKDVGPLAPSRASQIMQHGFPGFDNLRTFEDYVLSFDRRTKNAHWVCEHLSPDRMEYDPSVDRSKCQFRADPSVHEYFRADNEDFKKSGYDRGHLAAAGNHRRTQNSIDQTFLLTNMSPQVGKGFNRDKWNELEKHVRKQARKSLNVFVITGPLYLPRLETDGQLYVKYKVIGKNHLAVPTHFFKVVLIERKAGNYELECYVLPNEAIPDGVPLSSFFVPPEMIERNGGFLLFDKLNRKNIKIVNGKGAGRW